MIDPGSGKTRVQAVERASRLLMAVANGNTDGTGKGLAKALGLPVPTTHHLLSTLVDEGLLARVDQARYVLGPQVLVLADAFYRDGSAPEYMIGALRQLADLTRETSYVAAWRGTEIRMLASIEGQQPLRVDVPSGPYVDAHARATGKALLAFARPETRDSYLKLNPMRPLTSSTITDPDAFDDELGRTRERGYAIDEEEFHAGVSCVSVPVLTGEFAIAAFSISAPSSRFTEKRESLIAATRSVAQSVEAVISTG
ncbi:IclR family transcriptional regulator [Actinobacteria bacterium YIM 96077]|uniref:IclR family transcriptional regulator n=1 Tax=Phytoactinopolyspora halophila TaxID=1981511 RepID=A0A329QCH6_9ACTN|nr:IclR family transcriptional regulator [Phytoactinopolyspora halophila]AYY13937.1 IclR family transcriptional regulator [Actinobacteria bacterium YIM 96077]RAW10066.1 IclR family transcriptional regulator [Phytoactinopolyspora halophila]